MDTDVVKDYDTLSTLDLDDTLLHATTGNGLTMMSNRLSWFFDIRGKFLRQNNHRNRKLKAL